MSARDTFLADQLDAATDQAASTLTAAGRREGAATRDASRIPWFQDLARELAAGLKTRRVTGCTHLAGASPQMVFAVAWRRDRIMCLRCAAGTLEAVRGTAEDHRCDRCRRHVRLIHSGGVAIGPVLVAYGLCRGCLRACGLPAEVAA